MITLTVDVDGDTGLYYFFVTLDGETVCFRAGFRSHADATTVGDAWIKERLGAMKEE